MCGIAGIYHQNKKSVIEKELWLMGNALHHRGPDNQGVFLHEHAGLAYRRLSIIDTTEQEQPILHNENKSLRISFNGEIYNYKELRDELKDKGHRFYTGTDTEMILHLYEEEGPDCVTRLNGIFAFAILDLRDGSIFLARDHLGIKPLYFTNQHNSVAFASEIKSIVSLAWVKRQVNPEAVDLYFRYRFVPDPLTMFDHIYKLLPGHWMRLDGDQITIKQYWSYSKELKSQRAHYSELDAVEQIRREIPAAIKRQLVADVPLGAFLSGGIDSSIVVGLMAQQMSKPVKTYSVGFSESEYDEMNYAKQVSSAYKTDHHELILKPDHVKSLPDMLWFLDEPIADPAAVPTFFLSELARKDVTVVLTGEGGDELFAGYKEDFPYRAGEYLNFVPDLARKGLADLFGGSNLQRGKTRGMRSLLPERDRAEHVLTDLFRFEQSPALPYKNDDELVPLYDYSFDHYWNKSEGLDWLARMMYLETKIWLPGDPLMKVDKMTMAHGIEARVPLLDMEIVHLAAQIPSSIKNNQNIEKYLLRQAFADVLPEEIFERKKSAFEIPIEGWLQNELKEYVDEYLQEDSLTQSGMLDAKRARSIVEQHSAGSHNYKYEVWALLVFQLWWQRWFTH